MKESFAKITAWIKAHPIPSAIIGLVIVVVGYFVVRSSGGNSSGESIDGGSLGAEESSPLVGLGGGEGYTSETTPAPIPSASGESTPAYNSITTPQAAESIGTFGAPSDYVNESGIFSGATSAAAIIDKTSLTGGFNRGGKLMSEVGVAREGASPITYNKNIAGEQLVSTNTGQPVQPVSGGGVARFFSTLTALAPATQTMAQAAAAAGRPEIVKASNPITGGVNRFFSTIVERPTAPTLASIKPEKPTVNSVFSGALLGAGAKPKPAATPYKAGYRWDAKLKKFIKLSSAKPLKAY